MTDQPSFEFIDDRPQLVREFEKFHAENPKVYALFCRFARRAIARGFKKYSARTIWHVMRWHADVETTDEDFKLNNNHSPYYSRMFLRDHPEHEGFFELRRVQDG